MLFLFLLSGGGAGAEEDAEERIRELLVVSGIASRAEQLPDLMSAQVTASMGGNTGKGSAHLTRLLVDDLQGDAVVQRMVDGLTADLDAASVETLLAWYGAPPGDRVAQAIGLANSKRGEQAFDSYAERIRGQKPSQKRLRAAAAVDEATGMSRYLTEVIVETNLAVTVAVDRIFGVERAEDDVRERLEQLIRKQIVGSVLQQTRTYALFSMRTLQSNELAAYVEFSQSEAARRFHAIAFTAYRDAARQALEGFSERFESWFEKDRNPAVYSAAVREEGTAWGRARQDQQCLEEALRRDRRCSDLICEAALAEFHAGCLSTARPSPGFCDGVPAFEGEEGTRWRATRCRQVGRGDRVCRNLMVSAQRHCEAAPAAGG